MILPDPWLPIQPLHELRSSSGMGAIPQSGTIVVTNNDALYCPVFFPCDAIIYALRIAGTNTSGNYDIGFYDAALNRIASKGSTAMANATLELSLPNLRVKGGVLYYAAFAFNNNAATIVRAAWSIAGGARVTGVGLQASGFALPNPGVPATSASVGVYPIFAFGVR